MNINKVKAAGDFNLESDSGAYSGSDIIFNSKSYEFESSDTGIFTASGYKIKFDRIQQKNNLLTLSGNVVTSNETMSFTTQNLFCYVANLKIVERLWTDTVCKITHKNKSQYVKYDNIFNIYSMKL